MGKMISIEVGSCLLMKNIDNEVIHIDIRDNEL